MNVCMREMKATGKTLLLWCAGMILLIGGGMGKYGSMSASGQSLEELVWSMPKSLQTLMGVGTVDLSKATGYYGILFLYIVFLAAIHACMLGAAIIAKEERDKTAEFLLAKPLSRSKIVSAKLAAAVMNALLLNLVTWIVSMQAVGYYSKQGEATQHIAALMVGMLMIQLIFLSLGSGIAVLSKRAKTAAGTSTALLLVAFLLSVLIDVNTGLGSIKYAIPFQYYKAEEILRSGELDIASVLLSLAVITLFTLVTYVCFNRKDMRV